MDAYRLFDHPLLKGTHTAIAQYKTGTCKVVEEAKVAINFSSMRQVMQALEDQLDKWLRRAVKAMGTAHSWTAGPTEAEMNAALADAAFTIAAASAKTPESSQRSGAEQPPVGGHQDTGDKGSKKVEHRSCSRPGFTAAISMPLGWNTNTETGLEILRQSGVGTYCETPADADDALDECKKREGCRRPALCAFDSALASQLLGALQVEMSSSKGSDTCNLRPSVSKTLVAALKDALWPRPLPTYQRWLLRTAEGGGAWGMSSFCAGAGWHRGCPGDTQRNVLYASQDVVTVSEMITFAAAAGIRAVWWNFSEKKALRGTFVSADSDETKVTFPAYLLPLMLVFVHNTPPQFECLCAAANYGCRDRRRK